MPVRIDGRRLPLHALWSAALLLAAPPLPAAPPTGEPRTLVPVARMASGPGPFRLSIQRSEYVLQGTAGRPVGSGNGAVQRPRVASPFSPLIERQARAKGVDPGLVHAVIRAESGYRPDAVSPKGAVGLMQLMPATASRFGVADREHPESNVSAGTAYLRLLLDRFNSVPLALAAYNAGEGAVMRHGNQIPPYAETRGYVARVLRDYGEAAIAPPPLPPVYGAGLRLAATDLAAYRLLPTRRR
jgi:soluble lytic murein transglycosylase-like protein